MFERVQNMCQVLDMSEFWIFVNFHQIWQGSEYELGCNYGRVLNIPWFQVYQVSAYASIAQGSEYAWIWLNNTVWQGSEYAWSTFHRALNKPLVLNMVGCRIWQGCEYVMVTQGAEYAWISLNMPLKCLNICEYTLITLNMIWYAGIYLKKQSTEYARILSVSVALHSIRSLYKLLSSYRNRHIQNTVKHLRWSVLQKEQWNSSGQGGGVGVCGTRALQ